MDDAGEVEGVDYNPIPIRLCSIAELNTLEEFTIAFLDSDGKEVKHFIVNVNKTPIEHCFTARPVVNSPNDLGDIFENSTEGKAVFPFQ